MLSDGQQEAQAKSRQDQILLLAAEGMTDKEIAARLTLSPETVGTYWRRILSKYSAASRTEVVAKVVRLQAEAEVSEVAEVNECLKEVTDHLLVVLSGREGEDLQIKGETLHEKILEALTEFVVVVDGEGFTTYANRVSPEIAFEVGAPFEWSVAPEDRDRIREVLNSVLSDGAAVDFDLRLNGNTAPVACRGTATATSVDGAPNAVLSLKIA